MGQGSYRGVERRFKLTERQVASRREEIMSYPTGRRPGGSIWEAVEMWSMALATLVGGLAMWAAVYISLLYWSELVDSTMIDYPITILVYYPTFLAAVIMILTMVVILRAQWGFRRRLVE